MSKEYVNDHITQRVRLWGERLILVKGVAILNVLAVEIRGYIVKIKKEITTFFDKMLFHNYLERFTKKLPVRELF